LVKVGERLQLLVPASKVPVELLTKFTVPWGVTWFGGEESVTVAVQVVTTPTPVEAAQTTLVEVVRRPTVSVAIPLAARWDESPL